MAQVGRSEAYVQWRARREVLHELVRGRGVGEVREAVRLIPRLTSGSRGKLIGAHRLHSPQGEVTLSY